MLGWAVVLAASAGCRGVPGRSAALSRAVRRGDEAAMQRVMLPATVAGVDAETMTAKAARRGWAKRLRRPDEVHQGAVVLLADGRAARLVKSRGGWFFAEDPTDVYRQDTPEQAIAALVWASKRGRWDVLLRLAPRRYRVGLSEAQLEAAWTEGDGAAVLRRARDRVEGHLGDPIARDAHEARLDLGGGHAVRLERESGLWVVVDF